MSDDLISIQAAITNMNKVIMFRTNPEWKDRVAAYLKSLPSIDAVNHGRWEYIGGYGYKYRCSECIMCAERTSKYCPNCGARMDERKEE